MLRKPLTIQMRFNLVDGRLDFIEFDEVNHAVWVKIGNPDCTDFPFLVQLFQFSPCGIIIAEGPMQQNQIQIVRLQVFQRGKHRFPCVFIGTEIYLRDKEKLLSVDAACRNSSADLRLREILSSVYVRFSS